MKKAKQPSKAGRCQPMPTNKEQTFKITNQQGL